MSIACYTHNRIYLLLQDVIYLLFCKTGTRLVDNKFYHYILVLFFVFVFVCGYL